MFLGCLCPRWFNFLLYCPVHCCYFGCCGGILGGWGGCLGLWGGSEGGGGGYLAGWGGA